MPEIISPTQSAFVLGRMITDNVLLAYAITHLMHRRKGGRVGLVAVKLDMSKACDGWNGAFWKESVKYRVKIPPQKK